MDEKLRPNVWAGIDAEGFARVEDWAPGTEEEVPEKSVAEARGLRPSKLRPEFVRALAGRRRARPGREAEISTALYRPRLGDSRSCAG